MIKYSIVGLSGKRGSGKDALSSKMIPLGWERISFADELKKKIRQEFGLTVEQTDGALKETPCGYRNEESIELCPRDIMTLCGKYYRSIDPMFWVKQAFRPLNDFAELHSHNPNTLVRKLVVTDVRFLNEVGFLRKHNSHIVRINRLPELNIYKTALNDYTETSLDNYNFDYSISAHRNIDFNDLEREAKYIDQQFGNRATEVTFNI
jgi:hypothetical protein